MYIKYVEEKKIEIHIGMGIYKKILSWRSRKKFFFWIKKKKKKGIIIIKMIQRAVASLYRYICYLYYYHRLYLALQWATYYNVLKPAKQDTSKKLSSKLCI